MKNNLALFSFLLISCFCELKLGYSQNAAEAASESVIHSVDDLKTGNYMDVLSSFFQLAANDLTSDDRSFTFKSTLFAIKAKTNPELLIDKNYLKQYVARNLQFNFSLGIDQDYKIQNYSAGITYALINNRDKTVANFMNTKVDTMVAEYGSEVHDKMLQYLETFDSSRYEDVFKELNEGFDTLRLTGSTDKFPKAFLDFAQFDFKLAQSQIHKALADEYEKVDKQPLLTISANAISDSSSPIFDSGYLEMVFLQGASPEADFRAKLYVKDTFQLANQWRVNFNLKGGFNFVLSQDKATKKSVLELKFQGEYNHVFQGLLPDEDKDQIAANAELRIRITDDLWIPLTIKYDILNPNWFGFLNASFNLDAFKDPRKNTDR